MTARELFEIYRKGYLSEDGNRAMILWNVAPSVVRKYWYDIAKRVHGPIDYETIKELVKDQERRRRNARR